MPMPSALMLRVPPLSVWLPATVVLMSRAFQAGSRAPAEKSSAWGQMVGMAVGVTVGVGVSMGDE
jgi:hypothetical protein